MSDLGHPDHERSEGEGSAFATAHPAVFIEAASCAASGGECHLCGDEAVVGRVIELDEQRRMALIAFAEGSATVAMDLVDAGIGDDVLVHLGFAIERVAPRATESCAITRERDRGSCFS